MIYEFLKENSNIFLYFDHSFVVFFESLKSPCFFVFFNLAWKVELKLDQIKNLNFLLLEFVCAFIFIKIKAQIKFP
jgi:hypothetical protein